MIVNIIILHINILYNNVIHYLLFVLYKSKYNNNNNNDNNINIIRFT